jgi:hypothetical protein
LLEGDVSFSLQRLILLRIPLVFHGDIVH